MARRGGTVTLVDLPPGNLPAPIFDAVLRGLHITDSIVGTCTDLQKTLGFTGGSLVKVTVHPGELDSINQILD